MARAKRTDRADARRRYRASQVELPDAEADELDDASPDAPTAARGATSSAGPARSGAGQASRSQGQRRPAEPPVFAPGQRPSFTASFRAAARPINVRSDFAYLPDLALHTRAVWLPALICLVAFVLAATSTGPNFLAAILVQLFLFPPTIAGAFLAGILAPRATYLAGGIAGLIGSILFVTLVLAFPNSLIALGSSAATASPSPGASGSPVASGSSAPAASGAASETAVPSISPAPSPAASPTTAIDIASAGTASAIAITILESTVFGIAIGGFGGYYKRFLYASNPARQRRAIEQQRQKNQRQPPSKKRY